MVPAAGVATPDTQQNMRSAFCADLVFLSYLAEASFSQNGEEVEIR